MPGDTGAESRADRPGLIARRRKNACTAGACALSAGAPAATFGKPATDPESMVTTAIDAADGTPAELRIELAPNCSLTPRSARLFVGSLAFVTFGIAGFFAVRGLWPILPFAGIEIGLLAWAVRASMRTGSQREVIVVSEAEVVVERLAPSGSRRTVFPRHWARVTLRGPQPARHPSRLTIESHGRACEVGRFLTEEERRSLAARLDRLVGKTSESPALAP